MSEDIAVVHILNSDFALYSFYRRNNNKPNDIKALPILQDNQQPQQQSQGKGGNNKQQVDPMKEADVKRSIIPLEERMTMFTQLLREKQVKTVNFSESEGLNEAFALHH